MEDSSTVRFGVEYFIFAIQRREEAKKKRNLSKRTYHLVERYRIPILVSSICLPRRTDARILHAPSPPGPAP